MKLHCSAHWERTGGVFSLVGFALHWGNRCVGVTILNLVIELEF